VLMADLRLEKLSKVFPTGTTAVCDLDLAMTDGELLVLMGPSGCGKTTTLRLIAGLEAPTSGKIFIGEELVNAVPPHRRNLAMVFQRPALYPHLSVRRNLEFGLQFVGTQDQSRIAEVCNLLELGDVLDRRPAQLSGGQQQRVALGRGLMRRPRILLLDEPLSNLDARLRLDLRRQLHLLHQRLRTTIVYVTHDQAEAMTLGQRIAMLDRGILQQLGMPATLFQRPANRFVASSLGSPSMNLLDGELSRDEADWRFRHGSCMLTIPPELGRTWAPFEGRPLTLGFHPEILRVGESADSFAVLPMTVMLTETAGDTSYVYLRRESWNWTAIHDLRGAELPTAGESVKVKLNLVRAHLFDGVTGMALCHPDFK
jgi:multiple sugar transport system ATP-binding protein